MNNPPKRKNAVRKTAIPADFIGKTYLDPKLDPAFKAFFDSENTLRDFLNAVLKLKGVNKISKVTYSTEHEVIFRTPHKKSLKFDIYATNGLGRFFDIEMQLTDNNFFVDRAILNKAFLVIKAKVALDKSKEFKAQTMVEREKRRYELPETISIWLCDFDLPGCNEEFLDEWAIYSKNALKHGFTIPVSEKNRYIMISLPQFKKRRSELHSELDKWLYLLCNAAKSKKLPTFGNKNIAEALERIKVDRASDKLLTAQEISMSLKEDLESYFAGKIIDARQDERLILARNLFNMGKLTPAEISTASGVPASTIRRWKRKR